MHEFTGVYASAVTPRGRQGEIDFGAAFELIDHCSRPGIAGILLFGEDGEYASFLPEERSRLTLLAVKRSRLPLLAGVGSPTLDSSVALARDAWRAGATAVVLPPPCFLRYQAAELAEFYLQFARDLEIGTRILLYSTPLTTGEVPMETAVRLLETGLFEGVVDAGDDPGYLQCLRSRIGDDGFEWMAATDATFVPASRAGWGAISALAGAVPELAVAAGHALAAGAAPGQECPVRLFEELREWAERFPRPVLVKAALALQGRKNGPAAVPLSPEKQQLLEEFSGWFRAWLPAVKERLARG